MDFDFQNTKYLFRFSFLILIKTIRNVDLRQIDVSRFIGIRLNRKYRQTS